MLTLGFGYPMIIVMELGPRCSSFRATSLLQEHFSATTQSDPKLGTHSRGVPNASPVREHQCQDARDQLYVCWYREQPDSFQLHA